MKKKNTLVLAFCMAFAVSACAAGCAGCTGDTPETHEHNYAAAWSNDESYHWHACTSTVGTCDVPESNKAEHSWDDGVITQEATAEVDGVKTFTCTVCSKNKTESVEYVAPIHEHDYAVAWSSDESYHWHACTSTTGTCDAPQNSKAEHSWDNGVITQEATAEADGVKTFTCTVCSKNKTESVKYVAPEFELKENTDFAALVSEQVTEDEWKTAFEITNVTIKVHDNINSDADKLLKLSGSKIYVGMGSSVEYYNKLEDGTIVMSYGGQTVSVALDDANYQSMLEGYNYALTWNYPDFSNFYSSFTYDSAKGAYVLNQTVRTNSVFEVNDFDYDFAELKIINGKLAYIRWGNYFEGTTTVKNDGTEYFYDFGTTGITLPTA